MTPLSLALTVTLLGAGIAALTFQGKALLQQSAELRLLEHDLNSANAEVHAQAAALRRAHEQLSLADRKSADARLPDPSPGTAVSDETQAWLVRLQQLDTLLQERAEVRIPELDLLTRRDLLLLARDASFASEEDTRRTLAAVRSAGTRRMARLLASAIQEFRAVHRGETPGSFSALLPFIRPPLTPAMLQRWEFLPSGPESGTGHHLLAEKSPVDAAFDTRTRIQGNGGFATMSPPGAWIPEFTERIGSAYAAYSKHNYGASPPSLASLLPFFDPPLDRATMETLLRMERERSR